MSGAAKSENSKSIDKSALMRSEEKKKSQTDEKHATFDPQIDKKESTIREKSMSMSVLRQRKSEFMQQKLQKLEEEETHE